MQTLASHLGLVVTHQQLLDAIWGAGHTHNIQYLRILVRKLREKIEYDPNEPGILINEPGVGYRMDPGRATEP